MCPSWLDDTSSLLCSAIIRRHRKRRLGEMSNFLATADTLAPGAHASLMILAFSSTDQCLRVTEFSVPAARPLPMGIPNLPYRTIANAFIPVTLLPLTPPSLPRCGGEA